MIDLIKRGIYTGVGLGLMAKDKVEEVARERDACKLTLEVLEGNKVAQGSYLKFGFSGYVTGPAGSRPAGTQSRLRRR